MNNSPSKPTAPKGSKAEPLLPDAYFDDAWAAATVWPNLNVYSQFQRLARAAPHWIHRPVGSRGHVVGLIDKSSIISAILLILAVVLI